MDEGKPLNSARRERGKAGYMAGRAAECIVSRDYASRGYSVRVERWRGQAGEIDLILDNGADLVFVEVKASHTFDQAAHHLSRGQARRILSASAEYLGGEPRGELTPMRIDLALVDGTGAVRVIENAIGHD